MPSGKLMLQGVLILTHFRVLFFSDRQTFERMPNALKCQWFLQNLSYNSAVVVTISYWSFILLLDNARKFNLLPNLLYARN